MSKGKHMGKILLELRKEEPTSVIVPSPLAMTVACRTYCHPLKSYIITGGLGGFGLELAQWLVNRGATRLVLTSRSGVKTGYQKRMIKHWQTKGVQIMVYTRSTSTENCVAKMIEEIQAELGTSNTSQTLPIKIVLGQIGGIFHLAMVLRDGMFENQTVDNFKTAAEAKYHGTRHLDAVTREHCADLQWFIVFSSISSGRGNVGQTNYGWANSAMERIVEQRRADGFCGMAVQWGAIGN